MQAYLGGDIQAGSTVGELHALGDKSDCCLVVEEQQLLPDTGGRLQEELLTICATQFIRP